MTVATSQPVLAVRDMRKRYGRVEVLHGINLDVRAGEVVALVGENGAGKSTLSGIIAGATRYDSGHMTLHGRPYQPRSPRQAIDAGVALIHQELRLLPELSIAENIFVGRWPTRAGLVDYAAMADGARAQMLRLGLDLPPGRKVEGLSVAARQLVEIAKALALDARMLILDEPTAAIGGAETDLLFHQIARLKADGVAVVYISHRLEELGRIADRVVVLRDGALAAEFPTGRTPVRTIVESMVGRSLDRVFPAVPVPARDVVLAVSKLSAKSGRCSDVTFDVRKGEILGIAGLVGAGRTGLVRSLTGADPIGSGSVYLHGEDVTPRRPSDAIRRGIVMVPEDRRGQGLVLAHSLAENIGYANLAAIATHGLVNPSRLTQFAATRLQRLAVKGHGRQPAGELSGGNQQKVVLAKWLARAPEVIVLDEPTRGIDVGARAWIYEMIAGLASRGKAVLMVSSDLEEILGLSHRILVMSRGRQAGVLERHEATDVSIMELATSTETRTEHWSKSH